MHGKQSAMNIKVSRCRILQTEMGEFKSTTRTCSKSKTRISHLKSFLITVKDQELPTLLESLRKGKL